MGDVSAETQFELNLQMAKLYTEEYSGSFASVNEAPIEIEKMRRFYQELNHDEFMAKNKAELLYLSDLKESEIDNLSLEKEFLETLPNVVQVKYLMRVLHQMQLDTRDKLEAKMRTNPAK